MRTYTLQFDRDARRLRVRFQRDDDQRVAVVRGETAREALRELKYWAFFRGEERLVHLTRHLGAVALLLTLAAPISAQPTFVSISTRSNYVRADDAAGRWFVPRLSVPYDASAARDVVLGAELRSGSAAARIKVRLLGTDGIGRCESPDVNLNAWTPVSATCTLPAGRHLLEIRVDGREAATTLVGAYAVRVSEVKR